MTKLQHTPKPWKYTISKNSGRHQISDAKCGGQICAIWNRGKDITEANARLIAAAPEMLEALIKCRKEICSDCSDSCYIDFECKCEYTKITDQVIKKATGMGIDEILK